MKNGLLKNGLIATEQAALRFLQRYPRHITAALATVLLGGGGAAFAVASFGPDAAQLPVRQITEEPAAMLPLAEQAAALDAYHFDLFRTDTTRSSDTADALLRRLGLNDPAASAFLRRDDNARQALGRAGRAVSVQATDQQTLVRLVARWVPGVREGSFSRLIVERAPQGHGFVSHIETGTLAVSSRLASGVIRSSLFAATDDAGLPDAVANQIAEVFSGDIDFQRSLRKGDRFSVVYETLEADGEPLRTGRVLSAEFVNGGKTHQALWFQEPGQKGAYYTPDGQSMRRAYLASPVKFTRISSGFAMRFHPILHSWREHRGIDYAAPAGTPVRTVGDGTVDFAGVQNGYGNIIIVRHRGNRSTVYAHLSRIDVKKGQKVEQGQSIGAVGATGWATGPHLHFEFRVNGVFQDPLTLARENESAQPVPPAARPAFNQLAAATRAQLEAAASVRQASAQ